MKLSRLIALALAAGLFAPAPVYARQDDVADCPVHSDYLPVSGFVDYEILADVWDDSVITKPKPRPVNLAVYPPKMKKCRIEGDVTLQMCVTRGGSAQRVSIARSSGYADFDLAAVAWAHLLNLEAATVDGEPVEVCGYPLTYVFEFEQ